MDGIKKLSRSEMEKSRQIVLDALELHDKELQQDMAKKNSLKKIFSLDSITKIKKDVPGNGENEMSLFVGPQAVLKNDNVPHPSAWKEPQSMKQEKSEIKKVGGKKREIWLNDMRDVFKKNSPFKEVKIKNVEKTEKKTSSLKEKSFKAANRETYADTKVNPDFDYDFTPALAKKLHKNDVLEKKRKFNFIEKAKSVSLKIHNAVFIRKHKKEIDLLLLEEKKDKTKSKITRRDFFTSLRALLRIFSLSLVIIIFCYSCYAILLLKLNLDTPYLRSIASFIPVPAIIDKAGIIEYYDYVDLKDNFLQSAALTNDPRSFQVYLVQKMVFSDLLRKYNLQNQSLTIDEMTVKLEKNLIYDNEINQIGISRIRKIKQLVDEGESFSKIANKYGDQQGSVTLNVNSDNLFLDFKTDLLKLEVNEISRVEYAIDGYYIFFCTGKNEDSIDLNYVFIRGVEYGSYLREAMKKYAVWSFVE
jgi:hypothetical protein